jgi:hypothetical protein
MQIMKIIIKNENNANYNKKNNKKKHCCELK